MKRDFRHFPVALVLALGLAGSAALGATPTGEPRLRGLEVQVTAGGAGALTPTFSENALAYTLEVESDVREALIVPSVSDPSLLAVRVNGESASSGEPTKVRLETGDTRIVIEVTDHSARTTAYTVTVRREDIRPIVDKFKRLTYHDATTGVTMGYRLFVPDGYDSSRSYPLVLFLHGAAESGSDNELQLTANEGATTWAKPAEQARHPCFVLAPQNPKDPHATSPQDLGRRGWTTLLRYGFYRPFEPELALRTAFAVLQHVMADYNVDARRIYATGLSMGCFGIFAMNIDHPDTFAAIVGIAGGLDPRKAATLAKKPIWVFHAAQDLIVDVSFSRNTIKALRDAGGTPRYTEYGKDVYISSDAHAAWIPALADRQMRDWLFEQSRVAGATE